MSALTVCNCGVGWLTYNSFYDTGGSQPFGSSFTNNDPSFLGDKSDSSKEAGADPLYVASRAQLNFAENVPLVLGIALLAELNGANRYYPPYVYQ